MIISSYYSAAKYGAAGDGKTNDAPAIQHAIDDCHAAGGGTVLLEGGHTYYSSSLTLRSNVNLHLEKGAVLKASSELNSYFRPNKEKKDEGVNRVGTPVTLKPSYVFLYAKDAENISVSGEGTIDGNYMAFVRRVSPYYVTGDFYPRPTMIYAEHCDHSVFRDITLTGAPFWTLHIAGCNDVGIFHLRIRNPLDTANSDGIDVDHSSNVRILGCHVECADDTICLKTTAGNQEYGPTENVIVSDCTLISTSAAIKIGTEGVGDFRNVLVHHCIISRSNRGISVQIRDSGSVRNVVFSDIMIQTRRFADCWWGTAEPIAVTSLNRDDETVSGSISEVRFENITCCSENGVLIAADDPDKIRDLTFRNVDVTICSRTKWPKNQYDFRPGIRQGVEDIPTAGFFLRRTGKVTFDHCRARAEDGISLDGREFVREQEIQ